MDRKWTPSKHHSPRSRRRRQTDHMGKRKGGKQREKLDDDPITLDGDMPQKRFYRQRAHCNPLSHNTSFDHPSRPEDFSWSSYYPGVKEPVVRILDIGCGFGGLLVALGRLRPDVCVLGMEIRVKVSEYVRLRIENLRREEGAPCSNAALMRTNAMIYLPNFFRRGQIEAMFFAFPDPHFKAKNHRRRIISSSSLSVYAYLLRPGGRIFCMTDVKDLHDWHVDKLDAHPAFVRIPDEEVKDEPMLLAMRDETEEGKKVSRNGGDKHWAVYRRIADDEIAAPSLLENI